MTGAAVRRLATIGLALSAVVDGGAAAAESALPEQGRIITGPGAVLAHRQRVEPVNRALADRLENLLPRLMRPYQIPVAVVTNGESADILDGESGKLVLSGMERIPARDALLEQMKTADFSTIPSTRTEMEARIVYAYEIDGGCPCDDTTCRIQ